MQIHYNMQIQKQKCENWSFNIGTSKRKTKPDPSWHKNNKTLSKQIEPGWEIMLQGGRERKEGEGCYFLPAAHTICSSWVLSKPNRFLRTLLLSRTSVSDEPDVAPAAICACVKALVSSSDDVRGGRGLAVSISVSLVFAAGVVTSRELDDVSASSAGVCLRRWRIMLCLRVKRFWQTSHSNGRSPKKLIS